MWQKISKEYVIWTELHFISAICQYCSYRGLSIGHLLHPVVSRVSLGDDECVRDVGRVVNGEAEWDGQKYRRGSLYGLQQKRD